MNSIRTTSAILAMAILPVAFAQPAHHGLGEHPAVVVKRLYEKQGYDYASKFYPHPAWLYLDGSGSPTTDRSVDVGSREQREAIGSGPKAPNSANCNLRSGA